MRHCIVLAITVGLAGSLLLQPAPLAAGSKQGAKVVVTFRDGTKAAGELISVSQDSLVVLAKPWEEKTLAISSIRSVRIIRRSRALALGLIGLAGGATFGYIAATRDPEDRDPKLTVSWTLATGATLGAFGALVGTGFGLDKVLRFDGKPPTTVEKYLHKLRHRSREARLGGKLAPGKTAPAAGRAGAVRSIEPRTQRP
jgi:hypothetical protein